MFWCWCCQVSMAGGLKISPSLKSSPAGLQALTNQRCCIISEQRGYRRKTTISRHQNQLRQLIHTGYEMLCTALRTLRKSHLARVWYGMGSPEVDGIHELIHWVINTLIHSFCSSFALLVGGIDHNDNESCVLISSSWHRAGLCWLVSIANWSCDWPTAYNDWLLYRWAQSQPVVGGN